MGTQICSDHNPLLIDLKPERRYAKRKPFRFEAAWLTHEKFKEFLGEKWEKSVEAPKALWRLQGDLKRWNKTVFGRIEQRKRELNLNISEI